MNRWKQYFQDLLRGSEMEVSHTRKETEQEINDVEEMSNEKEYLIIEDIEDAIEKLKNNRSSGPDNITELFKIKQNVLDIALHKVICQIWKDEVIPEQWKEGLTCPI
jgi:mannosyltransferase OCH1-like enzyme